LQLDSSFFDKHLKIVQQMSLWTHISTHPGLNAKLMDGTLFVLLSCLLIGDPTLHYPAWTRVTAGGTAHGVPDAKRSGALNTDPPPPPTPLFAIGLSSTPNMPNPVPITVAHGERYRPETWPPRGTASRGTPRLR